MNDEPIEVEAATEAEIPTEAVAIRETTALEKQSAQKPEITAAQAKIEAVANLTAKAYDRASQLTLTPEEIKRLQAEFPDEAFKSGAAGKEQLIYIEHAFLRDRLNDVIGLGQWALIPRSRWAEDFQSSNGKPASRVYVEAMLLIRGCFVAEAVGEMEYWKNNASQNFGDAVEGAKTAAFRRCCKEFGIGLQAWKKDWCAGWWARKRSTLLKPAFREPVPTPTSAPAPAPPVLAPAPAPKTEEQVKETFLPIVTVKMVSERQGTRKDGTPWTAYLILLHDGITDMEVGTFSKTMAAMARTLSEQNTEAEATIKPGRKAGTWELVSILPKAPVPETEPEGVTP